MPENDNFKPIPILPHSAALLHGVVRSCMHKLK